MRTVITQYILLFTGNSLCRFLGIHCENDSTGSLCMSLLVHNDRERTICGGVGDGYGHCKCWLDDGWQWSYCCEWWLWLRTTVTEWWLWNDECDWWLRKPSVNEAANEPSEWLFVTNDGYETMNEDCARWLRRWLWMTVNDDCQWWLFAMDLIGREWWMWVTVRLDVSEW